MTRVWNALARCSWTSTVGRIPALDAVWIDLGALDERRVFVAAQGDVSLRVTMMPRDTNVHGTIFGGIILSYIDQAGAVHTRRSGLANVVTVAMDGVVFHHPVYVGDLVSLRTKTIHIGRTSMRVRVCVEAERYADATLVTVTEAEVVYVHVDEKRRPKPIPQE